MNILYTAKATATSGRDGKIVGESPTLNLQLAIPKQMGGAGGEGTNPEQLFAGGYAACFSSALSGVARRDKITTGSFEIDGLVGIGKMNDEAYNLAITLTGNFPNLEEATALRLMEEAHKVCPYSNATRGNVQVQVKVGASKTI